MAQKSMESFDRLVQLLQRAHFLQQSLHNGRTVYINGPSGTLLRQNIINSWWERMVTKSDSTFPVSGNNGGLLTFFPAMFTMMNRHLPFSLSKMSTCPAQISHTNPHLQQLLNCEMETRLQFVHVCEQSTIRQTFDQVVNKRIMWWKQHSGNSSDFLQNNTSAENSLSCMEVQYQFPWGPETIETIHNKGEADLAQMEEETNRNCKYNNGKKLLYPHCIECNTTVELAVSVFLTDAYNEKPPEQGDTATRQVLQLHPGLAPFKVAITRHGKKQRQISEVATYIARELRRGGIQLLDTHDTLTSPQQQSFSYDELGIPFTVIVNDKTIDTGAILLRSRDTTLSETLAINKLLDHISRHVHYQPS